MNSIIKTLFVLAIALVLTANTPAQSDSSAKETLRGLKGIAVLIGSISPEMARDGMEEDQLRTDIELRLRRAGITVLKVVPKPTTPNGAYLYVSIDSFRSATGVYAFSVRVELLQEVSLTRNPSIKSVVATWKVGSTGLMSVTQVRRIRETMGDLVDRFANDYLTVNPK